MPRAAARGARVMARGWGELVSDVKNADWNAAKKYLFKYGGELGKLYDQRASLNMQIKEARKSFVPKRAKKAKGAEVFEPAVPVSKSVMRDPYAEYMQKIKDEGKKYDKKAFQAWKKQMGY